MTIWDNPTVFISILKRWNFITLYVSIKLPETSVSQWPERANNVCPTSLVCCTAQCKLAGLFGFMVNVIILKALPHSPPLFYKQSYPSFSALAKEKYLCAASTLLKIFFTLSNIRHQHSIKYVYVCHNLQYGTGKRFLYRYDFSVPRLCFTLFYVIN